MPDRNGQAALHLIDTNILVRQARAGDTDAFGELLARHSKLIRRTACAILKNPEDAEDVVQDVSLCVLCKLHTFEGNSSFSTWLTRIAINASLQRLRRARCRPTYSLEGLTEGDDAAFLPLADTRPNPEQQCSIREMKSQLDRAIDQLPKTLKEVALDHLYKELPMIEVAGRRGISLAATKSRAYRARKKLIFMLHRSHPPLQPQMT